MSPHSTPLVAAISRTSNANGLTLIECLVAITLIGVSTAVITPVMVFSVATRVQSQKAEQAIQIAQGEVEKIRLLAERGGDYSSELAAYPSTSLASIASTAAPSSAAASFDSTTTNIARLVNVDADAESEFAVQVFRTVGVQPAGSPVPIAFELGVRVYDSRAVRENSTSLSTEAASLSFTSGEGKRGTRPLAVIYTDIFQGDRDGALCEYWKYISTTSSLSASTAGLEDCT